MLCSDLDSCELLCGFHGMCGPEQCKGLAGSEELQPLCGYFYYVSLYKFLIHCHLKSSLIKF